MLSVTPACIRTFLAITSTYPQKSLFLALPSSSIQHRSSNLVEVAAAQDRQTLYAARRPERLGDKGKEKQQQQGQSQGQAQASMSATPPAVNSTTMAGAAGIIYNNSYSETYTPVRTRSTSDYEEEENKGEEYKLKPKEDEVQPKASTS
ncbi:hypothetical protein AZE42_07044, partial [Rhizopogon vesiculosus]